jgi:hypothetical protein
MLNQALNGSWTWAHEHELCVKWCSKHDFPVPASPIEKEEIFLMKKKERELKSPLPIITNFIRKSVWHKGSATSTRVVIVQRTIGFHQLCRLSFITIWDHCEIKGYRKSIRARSRIQLDDNTERPQAHALLAQIVPYEFNYITWA